MFSIHTNILRANSICEQLKTSLIFILSLTLILPVGIKYALAEAIINPSTQGSITIHKYDLTAAQNKGFTPGSIVANGERDTAAETQLANYAIEGVEFSYLKVADIHTTTTENSTGISYRVDNGFAQEINLGKQDATSDELNAAMKARFTGTNAVANTSSIETFIKGNNLAQAAALTNNQGVTTISNLPVGLYLVVETKVPANVESTTTPFLVSVPMTNAQGSAWSYDIHTYPKNITDVPELVEKVAQTGNSWSAHVGGTVGEYKTWSVVLRLPKITSDATALKKAEFVDAFENGEVDIASVKLYSNDDGTKGKKTVEFNANDFAVTKLTQNVTSANTAIPEFDVANKGAFKLALTQAGLDKINHLNANGYSDFSGKYLIMEYRAKLTETAVMGEDGNINKVRFVYNRTSNAQYEDYEETHAKEYSFGLNLTKQFSDAQGDMSKVEFILKNNDTNEFIVADKDNDEYAITGTTAKEEDATKLTPSEAGALLVKGLGTGTYSIIETKTDEGYNLLKEPIILTLASPEGRFSAIQAIHYDKALVKEIRVVETITKAASATVNGKATNLVDYKTNAKALAQLEVMNNKKFTLPITGDTGFFILAGLSLVALLCSPFLLTRKAERGATA